MIRARSTALACGVVLWLGGVPAARAQQFVIQGDGYAQAEPGMALLVLSGEGEAQPWVSAETMVWGGLRDGGEADVLVVSVKVTEPSRRAAVRLGRFVEMLGAMRPVHVDGASGWVRLPLDFRVEAFGGLPVVPRFDERSFDWVIGTRLSRGLGQWGSVGLAYLHRRDAGALADEEVGADVGVQIDDWLGVNARAAYDLVDPGFSEVRGSVAATESETGLYGELFATHRSPSRILPQTSLFSVLGDVASQHAGASGRWRVAPRLDLEATAAARIVGDHVGPSLRLGTRLRLDDLGESAVSLEGRREPAPENGDWTGIRVAVRVKVIERVTLVSELELVVPDDAPQGDGDLWPWALVGAQWDIAERWQVAGAVNAEASRQYASRIDALVRVTHRWEVSP
jgi:hypothetical protein